MLVTDTPRGHLAPSSIGDAMTITAPAMTPAQSATLDLVQAYVAPMDDQTWYARQNARAAFADMAHGYGLSVVDANDLVDRIAAAATRGAHHVAGAALQVIAILDAAQPASGPACPCPAPQYRAAHHGDAIAGAWCHGCGGTLPIR